MILIEKRINYKNKMLSVIKKYSTQNIGVMQKYVIIIVVIIFFTASKCLSLYISSPAKVKILAGRNMKGIQKVQITTNGKSQQLQLTPLKNIWSDAAEILSVVKSKSGKTILKRKKVPKNINVYEDANKGSILRRKGRKLTGIIDSHSSIKYEKGTHVMIKSLNISFDESDVVRAPEATSYIEELLSNKTIDKNIKVIFSRTLPSPRKTNIYEPEIAIVVDSWLANKIGSDSKIYEYLTIFWNGVKQRFDTIEDPKINIRLVGAVILRNSSDEPFSEFTKNENKNISTQSIMEKLSRWAYKRLETLPDHDILYYQTDKNGSSPIGQVEALGISYVGVTCKKYNKNLNKSLAVALGEDRMAFYRGVITATHEIAHNLGAQHDFLENAENKGCLNVTGYIMSYKRGEKNYLHFSKCSIDYMSKYLSTDNAACVRSNIKESKEKKVFFTTKLPGEIVSMKEQCRYITGDNQAEVYTKGVTEDSLCYKLRCLITKNNKEYIIDNQQLAAEGSLCPSGKRCKDGACVHDKGNYTFKAFF